MTSKPERSIIGIAFASPWIVGFLILILFPFAASFVLSLCRWDMINSPQWVGGENYSRLIGELKTNTGFATAIYNTAYYSMLSVPLTVLLGIALAIMLSWKVRGQAIYRTLFFLPSMIPVIAAAVLWMWLLDPRDGMINYLISWIGIEPQNWLKQSQSAMSGDGVTRMGSWMSGGSALKLFGSKDAIVLMSLWGVGNFMIIYLAAIGDIPQSLYEAARIDGASRLRRTFHITLPMLSPVILFNLVVGIIQSVQTFTSIYVLSEGTGAPADSLLVISLHLFLTAFSDLQMGYASAVAWILFCILLLCTVALFRSSRYWVHYRFAP